MCTLYSNIIKCIVDASHLIFLLNACLCGACSILSVAILLDLDSFAVFPSSSWSYVREIHVCVVRTRVQDACKILEDISSYSCMYIVHTHMCACKARAFSSSCFLIFAQMMFSHLRAVALGFIDLVCRQHRKNNTILSGIQKVDLPSEIQLTFSRYISFRYLHRLLVARYAISFAFGCWVQHPNRFGITSCNSCT